MTSAPSDSRTSGSDAGHPSAAFWRRLAACRTPLIAGVSGYALGGGCELALLCDMIVASESAVFGQPEITLGIIPGGGGTQRLARVAGKQRAMELVLTGRRFDAVEAERLGIVNDVYKKREWLEGALDLARRVAERFVVGELAQVIRRPGAGTPGDPMPPPPSPGHVTSGPSGSPRVKSPVCRCSPGAQQWHCAETWL